MKKSQLFTPLIALVVAAFISGPNLATAAEPPAASEPSDADVNYPPGYIKEAPLPEGYPPPSEPGKVVEKSYPLVRTFSATGNNAYMKCFVYLAKNKHEMTAPVIMDYEAPRTAAKAPAGGDFGFMDVERMHFILGKPSLDEPKEDGPVTVADMSQMRVLSIAMQGEMSEESLQAAEQKLEEELAQRKDIEAAGEKRVLGYNSPMVPRDKSYWEVQVPIKDRAGAE